MLITNGGKQAVEQTFATLLDPGDEVLLPAPYWTTYPEVIRLAGGVPVEVPTTWEDGFKVTVDRLEAARTARTKVLLFVSPSNPTGAVYPPDEVEAIGRWAVEHGMWVVTDEIYEHLVYGDARFSSMPVLVPELADTCVVINGVAKTYAMTGWRVGWMIGPPDVIGAAANLQSHATSNVCNVAQRAALAAVSGDLEAVAEMRSTYDRRRRIIVAMLNDIPGVRCPEPHGRVLRLPERGRAAGPAVRGPGGVDVARAGRRSCSTGQGGVRAGRGVRRPGLRPLFLCPRRRGAGRGHHPPGQVRRRLTAGWHGSWSPRRSPSRAWPCCAPPGTRSTCRSACRRRSCWTRSDRPRP